MKPTVNDALTCSFTDSEARMAKTKLEEMTTEELQAKLKTARALRNTVGGIFVVIVTAWIVLGLWRKNIPVFASTFVCGIAVTVPITVSVNAIASELSKRQNTAES